MAGEAPPLKEAIIGCMDLLLRWVTLRFFDTNTTVNLKCLDFLKALFQLLVKDDYRMSDYEANAFLPYLVNKASGRGWGVWCCYLGWVGGSWFCNINGCLCILCIVISFPRGMICMYVCACVCVCVCVGRQDEVSLFWCLCLLSSYGSFPACHRAVVCWPFCQPL